MIAKGRTKLRCRSFYLVKVVIARLDEIRNSLVWDKFGRPASQKPGFDRAVLQSWWYDQTKAEELATRRGN